MLTCYIKSTLLPQNYYPDEKHKSSMKQSLSST